MNNKTRKYWRSRDELQRSPAYLAEAAQEFQDELDVDAIEAAEGPSRRGFMGWMSAGLAASGLAGCDVIRRPEEKILPYSVASEELLPSIPQYYATAAHVSGEVVGLLVENHEGRPTKVEGNPEHRSSYGALNNLHQSTILDLYDPQRLRAGKDLAAQLAGVKLQGKKVAVLSAAAPSVQLHALAASAQAKLGATWYTYESVSDDNQLLALEAVFGEALRPRYTFQAPKGGARAKVVLALDSDFLAHEGPSVAYAKEWADTRRVGQTAENMSRLYSVEARYSLTGTNADHRVRVSHGQVEAFAQAVAQGLGVAGASASGVALSAHQKEVVKAVVADLKANSGGALVLAGRNQPPVVHALAALMNEQLKARGTLVNYYPEYRRPNHRAGMGDMASIAELTSRMSKGDVDALIILGVNAAYSAPADVKFADALKKVGQVIYLADQADETVEALKGAKSALIVPRAHSFEAWGDLVAIDGQISIQQPLIAPLHGGVSEIELMAKLTGDDRKGYKVVRDAWKSSTGAVGFHKRWRRWLHAGVLENAQFGASSAAAKGLNGLKGSAGKAPTASELDVLFVAGHNSYDGRYANNAWLQELPDPMTKITWDNAALLSPATAKELNVSDEGMVTVKVGGAEIQSVAWIMPGQADNTVVLSLGYGRKFSNYLEYHHGAYHDSDVTGFDVSPLRTAGGAFSAKGAVSATGEDYVLAVVQRYGSQDPDLDLDVDFIDYESRPLVREATVAQYGENPTFAKPGIISHHNMPDQSKFAVLHPEERSIFGDYYYGDVEAEIAADLEKFSAELRAKNKNAKPKMSEQQLRDEIEKKRSQLTAAILKGRSPMAPHSAKVAAAHQWGMTIDLNACNGCNSCMVACVSENNISMVGKDQVRRGREMHWIRMDRYFVGDEAEPQVVHQPIACQQCETAPCENVCPVAATVHSPEGLNDMVYNRCIGTRYCANNCPFKVRRFNFYNYAKGQDELFHMQRNPNVTVRFRGVMEKCTYCVQRINKGKRRAALNPEVGQQIIDHINPACAQGCPAQAITFGDLKNPNSEVSKLKKTARDYRLLTELNLQARTSFLAKIRNPNPNFPKAG